jgi:type I restriction enzyme S subunit
LNEEPNNIEFQRSVGIIKPDTQKISSYYLYLALKQRKNELIHSAHGAVQQCIFISDLKKFEIVDAPKTKIDEFDKIVVPIFEKIKINQQENSRLSTLRDTLLPKLMSGEIKI